MCPFTSVQRRSDNGVRRPVHHGRIFSQTPSAGYLATPLYTAPTTPVSGRNSPLPAVGPIPTKLAVDDFPASQRAKVEPYICVGFKIEDKVIYISDVSHIPEDAWSLILARDRPEVDERVPLLVLDCLRVTPHTSHFGLKQATETVRRLAARRSYLVGFTHDLTHEEYSEILEAVSGEKDVTTTTSEAVQRAVELVKGEGSHWVQPAYDGLRVVVTPSGDVREVECTIK